jgi:putative ABC transport system substrate-binding protein
MTGFRRGLSEAGYVEGRNIAFALRWTEGRRDRLPELAADLVDANASVIVAGPDTAAALAARAATAKTPIVFATEDDPVRFGIVASLERPGGNATGVYMVNPGIDFLQPLVPDNRLVFSMEIFDTSSLDWKTQPEAAFAKMLDPAQFNNPPVVLSTKSVRAMAIHAPPFLDSRRRDQLVRLAAQRGIPTQYDWRAFAEAGGLISYGISIDDVYAQMGRYAGRMLKGGNPGEMPVLKPGKFELVINLKTARALGMEVPQSLLARADQVIE